MNAEAKPRNTPDHSLTEMPPGIPFIIGNELAERFSFYGMRGILTIFMTRHLLNAAGESAVMDGEQAKSVYHLFTAGAYFFPIIGAIISDVVLGKYRTILFISLMYCLGHGVLALMDLGPITGAWDMAPFLFVGLLFIAIGAGGIKPCATAHVGDQFGSGNKHMLVKVFNWFYFSINLGAAASNILTPLLLEKVGPWAAFGLPGVLMAIATFLFWLGRNTFIHVPPSGWEKFKRETFGPDGRRALANLAPLFLIFIPVFWAIFDQTGSAWVLQAESMDRRFAGVTWLESQIQLLNPVFILTLIPVFTYYVYPFMGRFFQPTPLRKIGIGFVFTAASFAVSALIETRISHQNDDVTAIVLADTKAQLSELDRRFVQLQDLAASPPTEVVGLVSALKEVGAEKGPSALTSLVLTPPDDYDDALQLLNAAVTREETRLAKLKDLVESPPKKLSEIMKNLRAAEWPRASLNEYVEDMPNIGWQFLTYLLLTAGEVLVSIVCLEFAYTQSPPRMKSFIMGVYFMGVTFGNLFVSGLNFVLSMMKRKDGTMPLEGASYYWFFAGLMLATLVVYIFFARRYEGETFIQGESSSD